MGYSYGRSVSGPNNTERLFFDQSLEATDTAPYTTSYSDNSPGVAAHIIGATTVPDTYFEGFIYNIYIYNETLGDVSSINTGTCGTTCSTCLFSEYPPSCGTCDSGC